MERGKCVNPGGSLPTEEVFVTGETCPSEAEEEPLVTLPTKCDAPSASYLMNSWQGGSAAASVPLEPVSGCESLEFDPTISPAPTSKAPSSPTGLDFSLDIDDPGLTDVGGRTKSSIRRVEVKLPDGLTVNPSIAQGLGACSSAELARETADSAPGAGCPLTSKIGSVEVETPLLEETLPGSLYVAKPLENEFNSLLATYMVIKSPGLGIMVKQAIEVIPDPQTGRLTAIADDIPQLPFSHFRLHFRGGERAPLTTPSACGSYDVAALITPWSGGQPITDTKAFEITTGAGAGSCPPRGGTPLLPTFSAGTLAPHAGAYSPFVLNLSRDAASAKLSAVETTLPQGLLGKLAGIAECPEAQIAAARARGAVNQGAAELASPSCPASSEVGAVNAGAGSGAQTYVGARAYLAGPYKSAPLSLAIVTPAVAGPFDLGTVVVRVALHVDATTAQIRAVSDPLPSILHGVPLELRSIAMKLDRPQFTLNPTSCEPKAITGAAVSLLGAMTPLSQYFQASGCGGLGFKPGLALSLGGPKAATRRGGYPALRATLKMKPGEANIARISVALPHSEFLAQDHIKTICTRVQYAAGAGNGAECPKASIYGFAKAKTPLLAEPLEGPVYLRSSANPLPDLVAALNGRIDISLVGRIDSKNAGIRTTFDSPPDAPVSEFLLAMAGGKKGLIENSTDICRGAHKATMKASAQSGKAFEARPALRAGGCAEKSKHKSAGKRSAPPR
jgi:hypothetical protein